MNEKLKKATPYSDNEAKLTLQELKEKAMPAVYGYYKMRAMAHSVDLPVFGTKADLKEAIEKTLFLSTNAKTPTREELRALYELSLYEHYEKPDSSLVTERNEMESMVGFRNYKVNIFEYVPELNTEKKKLISYKEVYESLFQFTTNDLFFINLFKTGPLNSHGQPMAGAPHISHAFTSILYFPYTPKLIETAPIQLCYDIAAYYNLSDKYA